MRVDIDDDITDDWGTIRSLATAKLIVTDVNLQNEWQSALPHPDVVYRVVYGIYGVRGIAVWRYKCLGQKYTKRWSSLASAKDCWVVQYDKLLWSGKSYKTRPEHESGKVFVAPKDRCCVYLDELRAEFEAVRDNGLAMYRLDNERMRDEILRLQGDISKNESLIKDMMEFLPPDLE